MKVRGCQNRWPGRGEWRRRGLRFGRRKHHRPPIQNETPRKEGVVRVKILVDKYGKVTSATYDGAGSNTADSELIEMACCAAQHHHMDREPGPARAVGFVTIRFELE